MKRPGSDTVMRKISGMSLGNRRRTLRKSASVTSAEIHNNNHKSLTKSLIRVDITVRNHLTPLLKPRRGVVAASFRLRASCRIYAQCRYTCRCTLSHLQIHLEKKRLPPSLNIFSFPMSIMGWEERASDKRRRIDESIPPEWRMTSASEHDSAFAALQDSNILDASERQITESSAVDLLQKLSEGTLTSVEVTKAFCKRAAFAQQSVRDVASVELSCFMWLILVVG